MKKILFSSNYYLKYFSNKIWQGCIYYSFFYVGTNYLIPIGLVVCKGSSMEPTLKNNDIILTEKVTVRRQHLKK